MNQDKKNTYYHVLIESKENANSNKKHFELDKTKLSEIEEDIVIPYIKKEQFIFDGCYLKPSNIESIRIMKSENTFEEYNKHKNEEDYFFIEVYMEIMFEDKNYVTEITSLIFKNCNKRIESETTVKPNRKSNLNYTKAKKNNSRVFIVHGHDDLLKTEVARFIEKLNLEPIILHEQANSGKTIIEKIEEYSNVGFGIILYTPCDRGSINKDDSKVRLRARQNVVFEHGFLIGKIGRQNVCALVKGDIETPNDISGVVYIPTEGDWKLSLAKEMRNSGYSIDMNLIV